MFYYYIDIHVHVKYKFKYSILYNDASNDTKLPNQITTELLFLNLTYFLFPRRGGGILLNTLN